MFSCDCELNLALIGDCKSFEIELIFSSISFFKGDLLDLLLAGVAEICAGFLINSIVYSSWDVWCSSVFCYLGGVLVLFFNFIKMFVIWLICLHISLSVGHCYPLEDTLLLFKKVSFYFDFCVFLSLIFYGFYGFS